MTTKRPKQMGFRKSISALILLCFVSGQVLCPSASYAQSVLALPMPGAMVAVSSGYVPIAIKGLKVYPDNPFRFDFILDTGNSKLQGQELKDETSLLIKYFLTALTVPDDDQWVNLSPYEKDRIIPKEFGITEMGRDLLAQDYLLKQLTASLIYPEHELGKKFWDRVHKKAYEKYGNVDIPVDTYNKVWIMPDHAKVYESGSVAFITESHLKVMLESDYLALEKSTVIASVSESRGTSAAKQSRFEIAASPSAPRNDTNAIGSSVVREIVLPEIEKEVNEGKNFTKLRQIYHSMIMAAWFKRKLKDGMLGKIYVGANKVAGVEYTNSVIANPEGVKQSLSDKELIYQQYLAAFKQGVYNYIKEEVDEKTQETTPRKYFAGGIVGTAVAASTVITTAGSPRQLSEKIAGSTVGTLLTAEAGLDSVKPKLASSSIFENMVRLSMGQGSWDQLQSQWIITELIFSPGGIENAGLQSADGSIVSRDIGGNRPFWVYILRNSKNNAVAYAGRDDIKTLFPDRSKEIEELMLNKVQERKEDFVLLNRTRKLLGLFGALGEAKDILSNPRFMDSAQIGDRDYEQIKLIYQQYADHWKKDLTKDISLDRFLDILEDLNKAVSSKRWKKIRYLATVDQERLAILMSEVNASEENMREKFKKEDVQLMIRVHQRILDNINSLQEESRSWGQGKAVVADEFVNARRPAFHANIWVANWLRKNFSNSTDARPLIVDIGANTSVLWSTLGTIAPWLTGGVVDFENDSNIYDQAPNPNKVRGDISDIAAGVESTQETARDLITTAHMFEVVVVNFVLDQVEDQDEQNQDLSQPNKRNKIRQTLKAIEHLLAQNQYLVITLPKNSPLQGSSFERVLQDLGYEVVNTAANMSNALTPEAQKRILAEEGREYLTAIENTFANKVYHVGVYRKVRFASDQEIDSIDASRLKIRQGAGRATNGQREPIGLNDRFDAKAVELSDIFADLTETDFVIKSDGAIVTRNELETDIKYKSFNDNLAVLLWLGRIRSAKSEIFDTITPLRAIKKDIEFAVEIDELLRNESTAFFPANKVQAIMVAIDKVQLTLEQITNLSEFVGFHFKKQKESAKTKWELDNKFLTNYQEAWDKFKKSLDMQTFNLGDIYTVYLTIHSQATGISDGLFDPHYAEDKQTYYFLDLFGDKDRTSIKKAVKELTETLGHKPSVQEVAASLGISEYLLNYILTSHRTEHENLGIEPFAYPASNNTEAWRELIKAAANSLKSVGISRTSPSLVNAGRALAIITGQNKLSQMKKKVLKDGETWASLGIIVGSTIPAEGTEDEMIAIVRESVTRLLAKGIRPTQVQVEQELAQNKGVLGKLLKSGMTRELLGIQHANVSRSENTMIEGALSEAVRNLENKGIEATIDNVSAWIKEKYPEHHDKGWLPIRTDYTERNLKRIGIKLASSSTILDQTASASTAVQADKPDNLGGIDMNQKVLDLQTEGEGIKFSAKGGSASGGDMPFDQTQLQNIQIDGFSPVILQIVPTNLPLFIGKAEIPETPFDKGG